MKRKQIKKIAIEMVKEQGLINLSRHDLCKKVGIPDGSFSYIMDCTFTELVNELNVENIKQKSTSVIKRRTNAALRKEQLLKIAMMLSIEKGYNNITRDGIAIAAGVSFSLVTKYFGTMHALRCEIIKTAIKQEVFEIIAQGIVNNDDRFKKISKSLKIKAFNFTNL